MTEETIQPLVLCPTLPLPFCEQPSCCPAGNVVITEETIQPLVSCPALLLLCPPVNSPYDATAGEALMTEETIEHITGVIAAKGSDAWYQMPVEELLPERLRHKADQLDKGQDTMDVWSVVLALPPCIVHDDVDRSNTCIVHSLFECLYFLCCCHCDKS